MRRNTRALLLIICISGAELQIRPITYRFDCIDDIIDLMCECVSTQRDDKDDERISLDGVINFCN